MIRYLSRSPTKKNYRRTLWHHAIADKGFIQSSTDIKSAYPAVGKACFSIIGVVPCCSWQSFKQTVGPTISRDATAWLISDPCWASVRASLPIDTVAMWRSP